MIITDKFINELTSLRMKAEMEPDNYKKLKDKYTHDIECELSSPIMKKMDEILDRAQREYGRYSVQFMSFLKVGVGIEYDSKEVTRIYKDKRETPPAYDLTIRGHCLDKDIIEIMDKIIIKGKIEDGMKNVLKFIERCKKSRQKWEQRDLDSNRVGKLTNGSATRVKGEYNFVDLTGVVFHNENYQPPVNILRRLYADRRSFKSILWNNLGVAHGMHFVVPGKECKIIREVYAMDPEEQLDGKHIALYLRYIADNFDANSTRDQLKWVRKCLKEGWNRSKWIVSTDMEKYSDNLNRYKLIRILRVCGIIDENEMEELDKFWGSDVWDRDNNKMLEGSDSVKQGQYGIYDAMTIVNLFLQAIIYDILDERSTYREEVDGKIKIRSKNSALGDDTVLAFDNEHKEGLDVIKNVFGYMGVNISNSKTHIIFEGKDYRKGVKSDKPGFIDFAKRVITEKGMLSYVSINAIIKDNFDDHVMEYFRILEEDKELAEEYGKYFLKEKFYFIKNLHKINGGRRLDEITDDDMILFEYRMNKIVAYKSVSVSELLNQLEWIKEQGILLSETKLLGWLPEYDSDDWFYEASEEDDQKIIAEILNYRDYGRNLRFKPNDYIGKTWEEVKDDDIITEIISTIRINEKEIARRKKFKSHVYKDMSNLKLEDYNHCAFIYDFSIRNEDGYMRYKDMKEQSLKMKLQITFSKCVKLKKEQDINFRLSLNDEYIWDKTKYYLRYGYQEYRLYKLMRVRSDSRPELPYQVFAHICGNAFPNKDLKKIYELFMGNLPYLDEYSYFNYTIED